MNIFAYPLKYFLAYFRIEEGDSVSYLSMPFWGSVFANFVFISVAMVALIFGIGIIIPDSYSGFENAAQSIAQFLMLILYLSNLVWFLFKHKLKLF